MRYVETQSKYGVNRVLIGGRQAYEEHIRRYVACGFDSIKCVDIFNSADLTALLQDVRADWITLLGTFEDVQMRILEKHPDLLNKRR